MPQMIRKRNQSDKINIQFDIPTLNTIIKYTLCEFVPHSKLMNLTRLLNNIDIDAYNYNQDLQVRIKLITHLCDAVINNNLKDPETIQSYILQRDTDMKEIIDNLGLKSNSLSSSECRYITQAIDERLQYCHIFRVKDELIKTLEKLDDNGFITSYYSVINNIKAQVTNLMSNLQGSDSSDGVIPAFNFSGDNFAHLMDVIVQKARKPSSVLQTGIRQLNAALSPGFQSGRLYTFLAGTGKFKSGTLLNIAIQIRKYNPQILPVEDGMRKTILFITMENSIYETVERIFDMYSTEDDKLCNMTAEEVINVLREQGGFKFTDIEGIDIEMRYYQNMGIKTSDIYAIIQDLANQAKKVICVILDYIKRIDSIAPHNGDERIRISNASKELKSLAQYLEIPVITAMQTNREGNGILDAAMRENKQDVANFVGTANVGVCWDLVEETDVMILINPEVRRSTNSLYLSIKRLKFRGKKDPLSLDYFNHPFAENSTIRLEVDVDRDKPLSILSLSSDLETADEKVLEKMSSRPRVSVISNNSKNNSILKAIDLPGLAKIA